MIGQGVVRYNGWRLSGAAGSSSFLGNVDAYLARGTPFRRRPSAAAGYTAAAETTHYRLFRPTRHRLAASSLADTYQGCR